MLGQSPWMVQESVGPVAGSVSQNWTCWKRPPGELMQQVLVEVPEQERTEESFAHVSGVAARTKGNMAASAAALEKEDMLRSILETAKILSWEQNRTR